MLGPCLHASVSESCTNVAAHQRDVGACYDNDSAVTGDALRRRGIGRWHRDSCLDCRGRIHAVRERIGSGASASTKSVALQVDRAAFRRIKQRLQLSD